MEVCVLLASLCASKNTQDLLLENFILKNWNWFKIIWYELKHIDRIYSDAQKCQKKVEIDEKADRFQAIGEIVSWLVTCGVVSHKSLSWS